MLETKLDKMGVLDLSKNFFQNITTLGFQKRGEILQIYKTELLNRAKIQLGWRSPK